MCFWYISQSLPPIWYTLYEVWNIFQALFQIPLYWSRIRDKIYTNLFEIFDCINASFFDSPLGHWILLIISKYTHITFPWFVITINQKHTMLGWYDIFGCQVCWVSTGGNRGQLGVFFFGRSIHLIQKLQTQNHCSSMPMGLAWGVRVWGLWGIWWGIWMKTVNL